MSHPYQDFPQKCFWEHAVATRAWTDIFKDEEPKFKITPFEVICTGGSCFAQRISQFIRGCGFNFGQFEPPHPLLEQEAARNLGYGQFSARYGNLYTARQLRQLVDESFGVTVPRKRIGHHRDGGVIDLLRPSINRHHRFESEAEAAADRTYHIGRVRTLFLEADVYIFTLGLTESWIDLDGNAYGVHPEVVLKSETPYPVEKVNFDYIETYNDLAHTITFLSSVNPKIKFILTVSPVGLAATHQSHHVLLATSYSKSVLRAVAGRIADIAPAVDYFPSFELFSLAQSFGQFLASDLRDVSSRGVTVTMELFRNMYFPEKQGNLLPETKQATTQEPSDRPPTASAVDIECDEIMNSLLKSGE
jgi:hypothetical protein